MILFACSFELIEEMESRRDIKIGRYVSNDESTIEVKYLSEIFTLL